MRFTIYDLRLSVFNRFTIFNRFTVWALFAGFLFVVMPVYAQEGSGEPVVTDDEVNEVAKDLFCPVCESTPLDVCATQACADWRELIREKLSQGQTKTEIFDYFARQYGDGVLANPPRRGFNLILWLFPVVAVLVGGFLFVRFMQNLRDASDAVEVETTTPAASANIQTKQPNTSADDYISRVEAELNEL